LASLLRHLFADRAKGKVQSTPKKTIKTIAKRIQIENVSDS